MGIFSGARTIARDTYKNLTLKKLYPDSYRKYAKKPVIPGKTVFLEIREKSLTDNFRLIRAALEKREQKTEAGIHYQTSLVCLGEGVENRAAVIRNCMAAIPRIADAQFIFVNEVSYFLSCLPIRSETTVIQTWHACGAFKRFGYSTIGKGFGTTAEDLERYPVHNNFDYVTVSSPEVVWAYAEAFHMEDRRSSILPIGISRTDMFFNRAYREKACGKVRWVLKQMAPQLLTGRSYAVDGGEDPLRPVLGKKIVLYAPTFRGSVANARSPQALDLPKMKRELGRDHVLLIKHHPFVKKRPEIPESCRDFAFDMSDRLSIEELLTSADICITDYSSLVFEYSLFERPMIFFAFDLKDYQDERGFYYPPETMMPGPVCTTSDEVIGVIGRAREEFDLARVRAFKYRFMSACDGHATQRVLQLMDRCAQQQ